MCYLRIRLPAAPPIWLQGSLAREETARGLVEQEAGRSSPAGLAPCAELAVSPYQVH